MRTCLFCRDTLIFSINSNYKNSERCVKDDMLQFFGYQIESHLRPDDSLCSLCKNIIQNVAKLKRRLLPLIFRTEPIYLEDKPHSFGEKWEVFRSPTHEENNDSFLSARSPTPSSLLRCKRVVPYESPVEMKIAEIERNRSLSRMSYAKSDADSEIIKVFSGTKARKRRRGYNWTHRKNGKYSRMSTDTRKSSASTYSRRSSVKSRPISSLSIMSSESYESFYPPSYGTTSPPVSFSLSEKSSLQYYDGCLQNKRTRSVSKQQEEEVKMYFKEDDLHHCSEDDCTFTCEDIDLMAQHKIGRHKQLALFWCNYCSNKYTSNGDLEIHKRTHSEQYSCIICHKEFYFDNDLLEHWQEHVKKSVPCRYCGKRFVDKNICNKHQKNVHKRKNPSRIDYNKNIERINNQHKGFEIRILVQSSNSPNKEGVE